MKKRRFSLSYANVISTLALFVALGGTAVATGVIDGKKIKRNSITGKQIKGKSVPGSDLRQNSVRGAQVRESTLGQVPRAASAGQAAVATRAGRADAADLASMALALAPAGAAGLIDRCPAGTQPYAGACFESDYQGPVTWPEAAEICGDAGGRLPGLEELEGFRQEPGITLHQQSEFTSAYLDVNGIESGGALTVGLYDNGGRAPGYSYGDSQGRFRCVFPATNR